MLCADLATSKSFLLRHGGDTHIPHRAHDIPASFKKLLIPGKIDTILVSGVNGAKQVYEYFKSLTPDVHAVAGEYDDPKQYPETKVVNVEGFKIGLIHGHQITPWGDKEALGVVQRKLGVDVLVFGGTHEFCAYEHGGKFFVNPGSATGAYSGLTSDVTASFVLMDVRGTSITLYIYKRTDGEKVDVHKMRYKKEEK